MPICSKSCTVTCQDCWPEMSTLGQRAHQTKAKEIDDEMEIMLDIKKDFTISFIQENQLVDKGLL